MLFATLFTTTAVANAETKPSVQLNADAMRALRLQWLNNKPAASEATAQDEVAAVLMDWPLTQATATVLASSGGDASLYTTGPSA